MGEKEMHEMVSKSMKFFKDSVIVIEGRHDLRKCIHLHWTSTCITPK